MQAPPQGHEVGASGGLEVMNREIVKNFGTYPIWDAHKAFALLSYSAQDTVRSWGQRHATSGLVVMSHSGGGLTLDTVCTTPRVSDTVCLTHTGVRHTVSRAPGGVRHIVSYTPGVSDTLCLTPPAGVRHTCVVRHRGCKTHCVLHLRGGPGV